MALVVRDLFDTPGSTTLDGRVPDAGITGVAYEAGSPDVVVSGGLAINTLPAAYVGFTYSSALASYGVGGELVATVQFVTPSNADIAATKAAGAALLDIFMQYGSFVHALVGESPYFTTGLRAFDSTDGLVCTTPWTPTEFTAYTLTVTIDDLGNIALAIGATTTSGVRSSPGSALNNFSCTLSPGTALNAWELGADTGGLPDANFWTGFINSHEVP